MVRNLVVIHCWRAVGNSLITSVSNRLLYSVFVAMMQMDAWLRVCLPTRRLPPCGAANMIKHGPCVLLLLLLISGLSGWLRLPWQQPGSACQGPQKGWMAAGFILLLLPKEMERRWKKTRVYFLVLHQLKEAHVNLHNELTVWFREKFSGSFVLSFLWCYIVSASGLSISDFTV